MPEPNSTPVDRWMPNPPTRPGRTRGATTATPEAVTYERYTVGQATEGSRLAGLDHRRRRQRPGRRGEPRHGRLHLRRLGSGQHQLGQHAPAGAVPGALRLGDAVRQQPRGRALPADLGQPRHRSLQEPLTRGAVWTSLGGQATTWSASTGTRGVERITVAGLPAWRLRRPGRLRHHAGRRDRRPVRQRPPDRLVGLRRRTRPDRVLPRGRRDRPSRAARHQPEPATAPAGRRR